MKTLHTGAHRRRGSVAIERVLPCLLALGAGACDFNGGIPDDVPRIPSSAPRRGAIVPSSVSNTGTGGTGGITGSAGTPTQGGLAGATASGTAGFFNGSFGDGQNGNFVGTDDVDLGGFAIDFDDVDVDFSSASSVDSTDTTNGAPIATITLQPSCVSGLQTAVTLASVTQDPNGDAVRCSWSMPAAIPSSAEGCLVQGVTFVNSGESVVQLLVDDGRGGTSVASSVIGPCPNLAGGQAGNVFP